MYHQVGDGAANFRGESFHRNGIRHLVKCVEWGMKFMQSDRNVRFARWRVLCLSNAFNLCEPTILSCVLYKIILKGPLIASIVLVTGHVLGER